jgi:hypothetical protein
VTEQEKQEIIDAVLAAIRLTEAETKPVKIRLLTYGTSLMTQHQNDVVESGRPVFAIDSKVFYIGDGVTALKNLTAQNDFSVLLALATDKNTPISADLWGYIDSVTGKLRKISYQNFLVALKTYFDTLYAGGGTETTTTMGALINSATNKTTPVDADVWTIRDSVTGLLQKVSGTNLKAYLKAYFDNSYVPDTRTINNHALTANVTVTKSDIGLDNVPNTDCTNAENISSGVLNIARIPAAAIERLASFPADQTARYALTTTTVQTGDMVQQLDTMEMWVCIDDTNLSNSSGWRVFSAGTASSVPWSGITSKPTTVSGYGITDILSQLITGFSAGAGTVSASDSILQAIQKIVGNCASFLTASNLKTVNGNNLVGSGDIVISGGGGDGNNTAEANVNVADSCLIFAQASENITITGDGGTTAITNFGTSGLTPGQKRFVRVIGDYIHVNASAYISIYDNTKFFVGDYLLVEAVTTSAVTISILKSNSLIFNEKPGKEYISLGIANSLAAESVRIGCGNSSAASVGAIAIGYGAHAGGIKSLAMGWGAQAPYNYSIAEGFNTVVFRPYSKERTVNPGDDENNMFRSSGFYGGFGYNTVGAGLTVDIASQGGYFPEIRTNSVLLFDVKAIVKLTSNATLIKACSIKGVAKRGATTSVSIIGTNETTMHFDDVNYSITVTVVTDSTDGTLRLHVINASDASVKVQAFVDFKEFG